jgi:hypothetical protein
MSSVRMSTPVHGGQEDPRLAAIRTAVSEAGAAGAGAVDLLVDLLTDIDAADHDGLGRAALELLSGFPQVVARLDENARRSWWRSPARDRSLADLPDGSHGPLALALASTHTDGRIRERAVATMLVRPCPEQMPFLVLRTGDWVAEVRDRARAGLALLLFNDAGTYLPPALPTVLLMQRRQRGGFAHTQAVAALLNAPTQVRQALAASVDPGQRRFVFRLASTQGWLRLDALVRAAESENDVRIRTLAAEAACREAVWTRQVVTLQRLARSRRPDVRAIALTGLVRVGRDAEAARHLDDDATLVRAVARDAARRLGIDALAHYRAALTEPAPPAGMIAGLADIGSASDAPRLWPLLTHTSAVLRAQAVRALRLLDAVDPAQLIPLLRDPSPAVVRETTAALRPNHGRVPLELARKLLVDIRIELRRAGYRLLCDQATAVRLHAALVLSMDPDPGLARRGRVDVTSLARDSTRSPTRRTSPPELLVTAAQHADLTHLADRAAQVLGPDTAGLVTDWLARTSPLANAAP